MKASHLLTTSCLVLAIASYATLTPAQAPPEPATAADGTECGSPAEAASPAQGFPQPAPAFETISVQNMVNPPREWLLPCGAPFADVAGSMRFDSSTEHYEYLRDQAIETGTLTEHTMETIPVWRGAWGSGGNPAITVEQLSPEYAEVQRGRIEMGMQGQLYDRITACIHVGMPRWMGEPNIREFVNTPWQTWMMNDYVDETRRIYIQNYQGEPAEHVNLESTHTPTGDSIGFWVGDMLVVHTVDVAPGDFQRAQPLTSNQFESVEIWQPVYNADGETARLLVQATYYDSIAFAQPLTATYTFEVSNAAMAVQNRIRQWECNIQTDAYLDENGMTNFRLPGEPGYRDPRGTAWSEYPNLVGQSRDPDWAPTEDFLSVLGLE